MREKWRREIKEAYTKIAEEGVYRRQIQMYKEINRRIGYTEEELRSVSADANLCLGCGNPVAISHLRCGETVIDLGSGAGLDCFLAAKRVGKNGRIIGIDMTPAMIEKAKENARKGNYKIVEFCLGEIGSLPVAENTADVVISNCVINVSPNKRRVFEEAFRVLRPGGRLIVSDIVLLKELSESIRKQAHPASCVHGAVVKDEYIGIIDQAGFQEVEIIEEKHHPFEDIVEDIDAKKTLNSTISITVYAVKPFK